MTDVNWKINTISKYKYYSLFIHLLLMTAGLFPHGDSYHHEHRCLCVLVDLCPLGQWSPTFWAPGTSFVEDNFSTDGRAGGWFRR